MAQLLAARGPVTLLGHEALDRDALAERLGLDLSGCEVRVVPHDSRSVTAASRDVDLFVNVSHRSRDASAAPRSLYVVHFPTSLGPDAGPGSGLPRVAWGAGFHTTEGRTTWTDGAGTLLVHTAPGRPVDVTLLLGFARPPQAGEAEVTVSVDGTPAATTRLGGPRTPLERWSGRAVRVRAVSPAPGVPCGGPRGVADVRAGRPAGRHRRAHPRRPGDRGGAGARRGGPARPPRRVADDLDRVARRLRRPGRQLRLHRRLGAAAVAAAEHRPAPAGRPPRRRREGRGGAQRRPVLPPRARPLQEAAGDGAGLPPPGRRGPHRLDAAPGGRVLHRR